MPCPPQSTILYVTRQILKLKLLPSPRSLCSPRNRPMNQRRGAEAKNTTLFGNLADREDGRLVSLKNHLIWVWLPVSFIESERERRWGSQVKGPSVLQNSSWNDQPRWGDVLFPFPCSHSQVGRVPRGRPLCMIIITKAMKSKVKVTEKDPTWSPI